jgi:cell division protein FtsQ
MRRLINILLIIPVIYLIITPLFLSASVDMQPCERIVVNIHDSSDYHFVTKNQLLNLVYADKVKLLGNPVRDIPVYEIEKRINALRELRVAEVYLSIDGTLYVYVDQRNPVMRVMPDEGGDYFVDEEGIVFRKRNLYNPRLHIVGGNIHITRAMLDSLSVLDTSIRYTILKDVFHFVDYLNNDSFWSAQIDQIYIDNRDQIDLVPRVGNHKIHLGTFENYEGKLRNLAAFYDKVLPEVGWNKYSSINLEFRDQIVCRKRE